MNPFCVNSTENSVSWAKGVVCEIGNEKNVPRMENGIIIPSALHYYTSTSSFYQNGC